MSGVMTGTCRAYAVSNEFSQIVLISRGNPRENLYTIAVAFGENKDDALESAPAI